MLSANLVQEATERAFTAIQDQGLGLGLGLFTPPGRKDPRLFPRSRGTLQVVIYRSFGKRSILLCILLGMVYRLGLYG